MLKTLCMVSLCSKYTRALNFQNVFQSWVWLIVLIVLVVPTSIGFVLGKDMIIGAGMAILYYLVLFYKINYKIG